MITSATDTETEGTGREETRGKIRNHVFCLKIELQRVSRQP